MEDVRKVSEEMGLVIYPENSSIEREEGELHLRASWFFNASVHSLISYSLCSTPARSYGQRRGRPVRKTFYSQWTVFTV
jgi:hypothetical protein